MSPLQMKRMRVVMASLLVGAALVAGCAKKPVATPEPPPTPPTETPTPPPAPPPAPPTETAPSPGALTSEDLKPAFFDYDSYLIREDAKAVLDADAKLLRDNSKASITIEGHCDERGTVEYNQALGERRAQAARDYLVAAGIEQSRINIISYGKERPFAAGSDEASYQLNRRAHFVLRSAS